MEACKDYNQLLEKLALKKGIVFLLGHSDSGKTTFSKKLVNLALDRGKKVALVDSDVGQSTVGPPSCIGAQIFISADDKDSFGRFFWKLFFVGSTSPRGNLVPMIAGTCILAKNSLKKADLVIIDTTGLVLGDYGQELKYHKINLISPRHLVLFEKGGELAPYKEIFGKQSNINAYCLEMGEGLGQKSFEQRARYREKSFYQYFKGGIQVSLQPNRLGSFPPFNQFLKRIEKYSLLGLCGLDKNVLGLGIFLGFKKNGSLRVYTPLHAASRVKFLILGRLKITSRGKQL